MKLQTLNEYADQRSSALGQPVTLPILNKIETKLDELFGTIGIDMNFTSHFRDRVFDARNGDPITVGELIKIFTDAYKKHHGYFKSQSAKKRSEAVLVDISTLLNIPFVLEWNPKDKEVDMIAKTIMRKDDFHSPDRKLTVEAWNRISGDRTNIKPSNPDIYIQYGTLDFSHGQLDGYVAAFDGSTEKKYKNPLHGEADHMFVGVLNWSLYDGEIKIQMVQVRDEYKRQNIALSLVSRLQKEYPDKDIDWGMLTGDGAALYE